MIQLRGGEDLNYGIEIKWELIKEVKLSPSIYSNPTIIGLKVGIIKKIFTSTCMIVICEYVFHHIVCKISKAGTMAGSL